MLELEGLHQLHNVVTEDGKWRDIIARQAWHRDPQLLHLAKVFTI